MNDRLPILLAFYSLAGDTGTLVFGQLTYTRLNDLSFRDFSRRKTFRTLVNLYRTEPYASQDIDLVFDHATLRCRTDAYGSFYLKTNDIPATATLQSVTLTSGAEARLIDELYPLKVKVITSETIVVSDIDDTLLHSFISRRVRQIRTLMFTTMENRRAVANMQEVLRKFEAAGASCFYLSNSEQNLYPLIFSFLTHNSFPRGPLFLKKMRTLWDVFRNFKFPLKHLHKQQTLHDILSMFPTKKFVLVGDNTQHDLTIYMDAAREFPGNIRHIVIRKVGKRVIDETLIAKHRDFLRTNSIGLYYDDDFPEHSGLYH